MQFNYIRTKWIFMLHQNPTKSCNFRWLCTCWLEVVHFLLHKRNLNYSLWCCITLPEMTNRLTSLHFRIESEIQAGEQLILGTFSFNFNSREFVKIFKLECRCRISWKAIEKQIKVEKHFWQLLQIRFNPRFIYLFKRVDWFYIRSNRKFRQNFVPTDLNSEINRKLSMKPLVALSLRSYNALGRAKFKKSSHKFKMQEFF